MIGKAQANLLKTGFLDSANDDKNLFIVIDGMLSDYGNEFLINLEKYYNQKGLAASGKLISDAEMIQGDGVLQIKLPYYYDYVNKGVRGKYDEQNAPNSPYKFKSLRMNDEGRASLKRYIESGKAKISNIKPIYKSEKKNKKLSLLDRKVNYLERQIKWWGIKTTNYFDLAVEETFKDIEQVVAERIGNYITVSFSK